MYTSVDHKNFFFAIERLSPADDRVPLRFLKNDSRRGAYYSLEVPMAEESISLLKRLNKDFKRSDQTLREFAEEYKQLSEKDRKDLCDAYNAEGKPTHLSNK